MKSIRLLILASGRSYHATRWANALSDRGIKVLFVTQHGVTRPLSSKVEVIELKYKTKIGYFLNSLIVKDIINNFKPHIVHAHYATGYGLLGRLSTKSQDLIISVYGADVFDFPYKSITHKLLLKSILNGSHKVLSTSEVMANEVLKLYPKFKRPEVTPFGVDTNLFSPKRAQHDNDLFTIGIVKKLEHKYGIDVLLNAVEKFYNKVTKNFQLIIVGEGSELESLKNLSRKLGISKHVSFIGPILNKLVPSYLQSFDVFVVPSRLESESFGVAAVEASSCGLPVVVSNVGGLPEVILDKETGLVFKSGDSSELYKILESLFYDKHTRHRLGNLGRARVEEYYDWEKNVSSMVKIYEKKLR